MASITRSDLCDMLKIPFSDEQLDAICAPLEPAVIIAGAGTGKTTVMAARVVWLVATGQVSVDKVLGLTFTLKATAQLAERIEEALAQANLNDRTMMATISTYDAFAASLVSEHGLRLGMDSDVTMMADATSYRLAADVVASSSDVIDHLSSYTAATIAEKIVTLDAAAQSHLLDIDKITSYGKSLRASLDEIPLWRGKELAAVKQAKEAIINRDELLMLVQRYREVKARYRLVEFSDQMASAARLSSDIKVLSSIMRQRYHVVLLDEYQDTSTAQAMVLKALFSGDNREDGRGHPITAVGDPFQAIYGWRGAAPGNILQFNDDYPLADGNPSTSYSLRTNRRSLPAILEIANKVSEPLRKDPRLRPRHDRAGEQILIPPPHSHGGEVSCAEFNTVDEEMAWIARHLHQLHRDDDSLEWKDMAVLTRTNSDISLVYRHLSDAGIPVEIVGLDGLLSIDVIANIRSMLTLILDPHNNVEIVRLLSSQRWKIGVDDLIALNRHARTLVRGEHEDDPLRNHNGGKVIRDSSEEPSLADALKDLDQIDLTLTARQRLAAFNAEMEYLSRFRNETASEVIDRIITSSGVMTELQSRCDEDPRVVQISHFRRLVDAYVDVDGQGSIAGLLAWFDAEQNYGKGLEQATISSRDSVKIMTMHRSKGLEWQIVVIPNLTHNVFPSLKAESWVNRCEVIPYALRQDRDWLPQLLQVDATSLKSYPDELKSYEKASEDRLAYVAFTRAKRHLIATCHGWEPKIVKAKSRSPYFEQIAQSLPEEQLVTYPIDLTNPYDNDDEAMEWPCNDEQIDTVQSLAHTVRSIMENGYDEQILATLDEEEYAHYVSWARNAQLEVDALYERRRSIDTMHIPLSIPASRFITATHKRDLFVESLLRPMPRPLNLEASQGSRFHAWLEQRYSTLIPDSLFDIDPYEQSAELIESKDDRLLSELKEKFLDGPYRDRIPYAIEHSFVLFLEGQQIRGRIDAVFTSTDDRYDYQIVDWKTGKAPSDPLQLSLYRLAWAHIYGLPLERIDAVFYHVRDGVIERPSLIGEEEIRKIYRDLLNNPDRSDRDVQMQNCSLSLDEESNDDCS